MSLHLPPDLYAAERLQTEDREGNFFEGLFWALLLVIPVWAGVFLLAAFVFTAAVAP